MPNVDFEATLESGETVWVEAAISGYGFDRVAHIINVTNPRGDEVKTSSDEDDQIREMALNEYGKTTW